MRAFHYVATVEKSDIKEAEVSVIGQAAKDAPPFVGHRPRLRFLDDKVILIADADGGSPLRWCSFPAGDVITHLARPGDTLQVSRRGAGLVIQIARAGRLLAAAGSLLGIDLGVGFTLTRDPVECEWASAEAKAMLRRFDANSAAEPIVPDKSPQPGVLITGGHSRHFLRNRESVTVAGYDLYVEFIDLLGPFGQRSEYLSVAAADNPLAVIAARRSATLMAHRPNDLRGESVRGKMLRTDYDIEAAWHEDEEPA